MDRERRNRGGSSPGRDARTALLSRIAQRRAEKSKPQYSIPPTQAAQLTPPYLTPPHLTPLPLSDDSGSETEGEIPPFSNAGSSRVASSSDSSALKVDAMSNILDTLGTLSIGKIHAPNSVHTTTSTFRQFEHKSSFSIRSAEAQLDTFSGGLGRPYAKSTSGNSKQIVDLSSDDEDYNFNVKKISSQSRQASTSMPSDTLRDKDPEPVGRSQERDEEWLTDVEDADMVLGEEGSLRFVLAGKIAKRLYAHQKSGIRWLWGLHLQNMGGILGDDMGLGKTLQIASFFSGLFATKVIRTALVVAPKTLISHWVNELSLVGLARKTYSFVDPTSRARNTVLQKVLQMGGVLLTTYDMVRCNVDALKGEVHGRDGYGDRSDHITTWDYLVLDEGHLIKNPNTGRATSLRELPSTHRIIISGTPIQNNLKEMWALMDFVCPNLLGDKRQFKDKFERQIVAGNDKDASDRQKRLGAAVAQELRLKISPFFLRRMKAEVFPEKVGSESKLSRKNDLIIWLRLTPSQEHLYRAFLESEAVSTAISTRNALAALSVLKKICDHPSLLTKRAAEDIADGMEDMMGSNDRVEAEAMTASLAGLAEDLDCGENSGGDVSCKIVFLLILLEKLLKDGHRTLIFSQTRKMLNIIQDELEERNWTYRRIDGTMKSSDRAYSVDDFQSNPDIPFFLLTSQVGGLGLTLTAADRVVIVDPAWNPSVDNQSVDRAYRIGQKKDVTVYRLMTSGTLEEKVYRKQVFKGGLMKIATEDKNQMRYFSTQMLKELFRIPATGFSMSATQKQLAEEHFGEHRATTELEEHIRYLEGLSMITGVSHHDVLYSKAAPPLPPAEEGQDDANVKWEPRNVAYNPKSKLGSKVEETYIWDPANDARTKTQSFEPVDEAKHAYLRLDYYKDKIGRLNATLQNKETVSKLSDGGAKIEQKIKELTAEMETLKVKALPYEQSLPSSDASKRPSNSKGNSQVGGLSDRGAVSGNASNFINLGEPIVRIRSASGNNIYNSPGAGTTGFRKLKVPESGRENVEDLTNSFRV